MLLVGIIVNGVVFVIIFWIRCLYKFVFMGFVVFVLVDFFYLIFNIFFVYLYWFFLDNKGSEIVVNVLSVIVVISVFFLVFYVIFLLV